MKPAIFLLAVLTLLAACETTKGVGRDVQNAGEALDRTFWAARITAEPGGIVAAMRGGVAMFSVRKIVRKSERRQVVRPEPRPGALPVLTPSLNPSSPQGST